MGIRKKIAYNLISVNPKQAEYYFRLGRTHSYLKNYTKAKQVYQTGLQYRHGLTFKKLIKKIQRSISNDPSKIKSEYIFINGRNNLGAIIHEYQGKKYFTKISLYARGAQREELFYRELCKEFPSLQQVVPLFIDSQVIDRIIYLTLKMIDGVPTNSKHINQIFTISKKISSIRNGNLLKTYPNPNYLFQLRNRPFSIIVFFIKIHDKYYNERLFSSLHKLTKQNNFPSSVNQVILRLESLIMENHLYAFIKPKKHYALLHGDFIPQNISIDNHSKKHIVFDWATFTIGPHFMDVARFVTTSFTPYSSIKESYLANDQYGGKMTLIEKIFFLYALILLYTLMNTRKNIEAILSDYILPCLNDLESLINEFKEKDFHEEFKLILNEKERYKQEVESLNKKISSLNKEKAQLQNKYKSILNSKSWKITRPLRKFLQIIKQR